MVGVQQNLTNNLTKSDGRMVTIRERERKREGLKTVLGAYGGSNPRFVGDFPIWDSFNN